MSYRRAFILPLLVTGALLSGCGRHQAARVSVPPAPTVSEIPAPPPARSTPAPTTPPSTQAVYVEVGLASWYGPPYHNRRGSNGEIYNMNALTAAHRTLPLGTRVRVTNLKTGHSIVVRITDRGPFIRGRIVDLSLAAAKAVDVRRPGVAKVKLEVVDAPASIDTGGRWAIQIGAFQSEDAAQQLVDRLSQRYRAVHVREFSSPVGDWWVRVRVPKDDKLQAQEIARDTHTSEGAVFLVRLD
jgi:rare lipoprotein A